MSKHLITPTLPAGRIGVMWTLALVLTLVPALVLVSGLTAGRAQAQAIDEPAETTAQPICFEIRNTAPYTVLGSIVTNFYTDPSTGEQARHHGDFRIASDNFVQICSSGPFFPGHKLDFQLRSLFPLFECRTGTDGPIIVHGQKNDDGTYKTWADCR